MKQPMLVEIIGFNLPGSALRSQSRRSLVPNIHVGIARGTQPLELVRGDAAGASWRIEVAVRHLDSGDFDFSGPFVHGKRGARFLNLRWGDVQDDGTFELFRAAGLRLDAGDPVLIEQALLPGKRLVGRLSLSDRRGFPRCASVRPPDIEWSVAAE